MAMHSINRFRLSTSRVYDSPLEFNSTTCRAYQRMITLDGHYSINLYAIGLLNSTTSRMGVTAKSFTVGAVSMAIK